VLAQKRVLAAGSLDEVAATDDAWIQAYFHGPRGRAAEKSALAIRPAQSTQAAVSGRDRIG
jgi:phospholipid/cholesterol/gamma-HCH transport system ATP-binding protein